MSMFVDRGNLYLAAYLQGNHIHVLYWYIQLLIAQLCDFQAVKANKETPVLQCHGEADPLVNMSFGSMTGQLLKSFNKNHKFKQYPGLGHSSNEEVSMFN